jgi:hypothetical protein
MAACAKCAVPGKRRRRCKHKRPLPCRCGGMVGKWGPIPHRLGSRWARFGACEHHPDHWVLMDRVMREPLKSCG